jgi:hypothetical protein
MGTPTPGGGQGPQRGRMGTFVRQPKTIVGAIAAVLAVWFIIGNNEETRIRFWVVWVTTQLWVALLIAVVLGFIAGYLFKRRSVGKKQ